MSRTSIIRFVAATSLLTATSLGAAGSAFADSAWSLPATTDGAPTCTVTAVGGDDLTGQYPDGRMIAHDNVVSGEFVVTGDSNCKVNVTLTTWTAPNGFDGKPYDQQAIFDTKTQQYSVGTHDLTVHIPDCYYQADLVRGDAPAGYDNGPIYEDGRMMASLHAGTQSCNIGQGGSGGGTTPTQPTSPTQPAQPSQPTVPTTPTVPVTPTQPSSPSQPGQGSGTGTTTPPATPVAVTPVITTIPVTTLPATGSNDAGLLIAVDVALAAAMFRSVQLRRHTR